MKYVSKESKLTKIGNKVYSNTLTPCFPLIAYDFIYAKKSKEWPLAFMIIDLSKVFEHEVLKMLKKASKINETIILNLGGLFMG